MPFKDPCPSQPFEFTIAPTWVKCNNYMELDYGANPWLSIGP